MLVARRGRHHPHRLDPWQVTRPAGARFAEDMRAWNRAEDDDVTPAALRFPRLTGDADQADEVLAYASPVAVWEPDWSTPAPVSDPTEPIPLAAARYLGCSACAEEPTPRRLAGDRAAHSAKGFSPQRWRPTPFERRAGNGAGAGADLPPWPPGHHRGGCTEPLSGRGGGVVRTVG